VRLARIAFLLSLIACATSAGAADDVRLPLVEKGEVDGAPTSLVWSPGVRRSAPLLAELRARAARDIANFVRARKTDPKADKTFVRFVQERMASDAYESFVVKTGYRDSTAETADDPQTLDIAAGKQIVWADLVDPTNKDAAGKAVHEIVARVLHAKFPIKPGKVGAQQAGELKHMTGWVGDTLDTLPPFAFAPSRDGAHVAGLTLFLGERTPFGLHDGDPLDIGEIFLPAAKLKPWLASTYQGLFGGEALPLGEAQRERTDDAPPGNSAVVLSRPMKPGKTLTFRAEAPSTFFNAKDEIEIVVDDEALGAPFADPKPNAIKSFVAVGHATPGAKPSGVGFDLRVFTVTINYRVDAFAAACRGAAAHIRAAPGSPAAAAKTPWINVSYPIERDCGDYQG